MHLAYALCASARLSRCHHRNCVWDESLSEEPSGCFPTQFSMALTPTSSERSSRYVYEEAPGNYFVIKNFRYTNNSLLHDNLPARNIPDEAT